MKVFSEIENFIPPPAGVTLTIGNFDGVHRGHQRLIEKARQVGSDLGTSVLSVTFEPHPLSAIAPDRAPARLTTAEEKLHLLRTRGVDMCLVLRGNRALLALSAEEFLANLTEACRPRAIVEGPDFNFGRGRRGSVRTLQECAGRLGYSVHIIETTRCEELPGTPSIHSAAIRSVVHEGRVDVARAMLGRPYRITGTVVSGAGRGARLGFPTANLDAIPHLPPGQGVYAAVAQLEDDRLCLAAVNVGPQPTFQQSVPCVEAHVLDQTVPLRGQRLGLHFLTRLRGQKRFESVEELITQIKRDVVAVRQHDQARRQLESRPLVPLR